LRQQPLVSLVVTIELRQRGLQFGALRMCREAAQLAIASRPSCPSSNFQITEIEFRDRYVAVRDSMKLVIGAQSKRIEPGQLEQQYHREHQQRDGSIDRLNPREPAGLRRTTAYA
jgi:hypothetical protein